jgi:uncharacterized protein (DUF1330 family)
MPAYFIAFRDRMKDPARYAAYLEKAVPTFEGHEMRPLVANGAMTPLEGDCPDGVVILEFPDVAAAKAWYECPEYQAVIGERLAATEGRALIVEGIELG